MNENKIFLVVTYTERILGYRIYYIINNNITPTSTILQYIFLLRI